VICIESERLAPVRTDDDGPSRVRVELWNDADGAACARWEHPHGRLTFRAGVDEGAVQSFDLSDGIVLLVGRVLEFVEAFTPEMDAVRGLDALAGPLPAAEAVRLLSCANGEFIALVVGTPDPTGGRPPYRNDDPFVATVLTERVAARRLYYGQRGGHAVVSTSAVVASERLGFDREFNPERVFDICLHRALVDEQTLFRGVKRRYFDEVLEMPPGGVRTRRLDLKAVEMPTLRARLPNDRFQLDVARALVRRSVAIRLNRPEDRSISLLASSGIESRLLMALARERGAEDLLAIAIGSRRGFDESGPAAEFASAMGYRCARFMEEELDFQGLLESYVESCGHPPKYYNHLLLDAALRELGKRDGWLWTGDNISLDSYLPFLLTHDARRNLPWIPPPGVWKLLSPVRDFLPGRVRAAVWFFELDPAEAAIVSLTPERSLDHARAAVTLFGRRAKRRDPSPQRSPALTRSIARLGRKTDYRDFAWLWSDIVFAGSVTSRDLLAKRVDTRLSMPFMDVTLLAFGRMVLPQLPGRTTGQQLYKRLVAEAWLPRDRWHPKRGLVADLPGWFRDPKKLAPYLDVVASRSSLERGIFDRDEVQRLLGRSRALTPGEARLLWTVLTTELLFTLGVVRVGSSATVESRAGGMA
jgi:hypothetical protein